MQPSARPSLWRHGDFMRLWIGQSISELGSQVTLLALPLVAIVILRATPLQIGLLEALAFLPFLLVGLPAGAWVDRLRRRPVLILGDLGRAATLLTIPLAYEAHTLSMVQLYVVAFVAGVLTVFFDVAYQSYLPALVSRAQLVEGNSKLEVTRSGAQLVGPALAGVLIGLFKAPFAILADAASFFVSAFFVATIRKHEPAVVAEGEPAGSFLAGMRRDIAEGLRYVLGHPLLRPIAACTSTSNLFGNMAFAVYLLYLVRNLHLGPGTIGVVLGLGNLGYVVGALLAAPIAERFGLGRAIIWSIPLGLGMLLVPLAPVANPIPWLVAAGLIWSFCGPVYNINQVSLRQAITPERMQGRMNATMRFIVWGTIPIGSLIGGALGGAIGLRPTLVIGTLGMSLAFLPPLFSPVRKLRSIPAPAD